MKSNKKLKGMGHEGYNSHVMKNNRGYNNRLAIGIPMTGVVRSEWMLARYGQIIPTNWSQLDIMQFIHTNAPLQFMVADARNLIVASAIEKNMEWLLFIDHDVIIPPDTFLRLNDYIREDKYPIVSGIYWTRSVPSEPLIYRGRGNSYFAKWKLGDKVMADGTHMGCTLINMKVIRALWDKSEEYQIAGYTVRRVFETPAKIWYDSETGNMNAFTGTEDLFWCDRVRDEGILKAAGYPEFQKMKYPILIDTGISCYHMDIDGRRFPENVDLLATRNANKHPKFIK
jgi:hypothetical protein